MKNSDSEFNDSMFNIQINQESPKNLKLLLSNVIYSRYVGILN